MSSKKKSKPREKKAENNLATELSNHIKAGACRKVRDLLDPIHEANDIQEIQNRFNKTDPVILAIECREEEIAIYLIEKGFTTTKLYNHEDQLCDQWCYFEHASDKCPSEYDALDLSKEKTLTKVMSLIQEIRNGSRLPGDGLANQQNSSRPTTTGTTDGDTRVAKGMASAATSDHVTRVGAARQKLDNMGATYLSPSGDTPVHAAVHVGPEMVHACACARLNINAQNHAGDTALHVAVRGPGGLEAARALLMCGADLSVRNKLGQTAADGATGLLQQLTDSYKPGLVQAVMKGDQVAINRLIKLWCHPDAIIKDGKSAVQLARDRSELGRGHQATCNLLTAAYKTLELVHAVLEEDMSVLKRLLRLESGWNINVRYQDRWGMTPVSCAVRQGCLEAAQLLADTGRVQYDIRIRETPGEVATLPLLFLSLEPESPVDMWCHLAKERGKCPNSEKDNMGNNELCRAIANNLPLDRIERVVRIDGLLLLPERNITGHHARELALSLGRDDVVAVIDEYVCTFMTYLITNLAVNFYGESNIRVNYKDGRFITELLVVKEDIQAVNNYSDIERLGTELFTAAATGDVKYCKKHSVHNYKDKNGYTALTRAIVFLQLATVKALLIATPVLNLLPDTYNRYPLHYAYALPPADGQPFIKLLLSRRPEEVETTMDKDGRTPAEFADLRDSQEVIWMLHNARTLDPHGQRGAPLGPMPPNATVPDV